MNNLLAGVCACSNVEQKLLTTRVQQVDRQTEQERMSRKAVDVLSVWVGMWQNQEVPASDVAYVLQRLLAETEEIGLFDIAPQPIQEELLAINEGFKKTGKQELGASGGSGSTDSSDQAARCIRVLDKAAQRKASAA